MISNPITKEVVDRLYRTAEGLSRDWRDADLGDNFGSLMVAAVIRHLKRVGCRKEDGTVRTPTEQVEFAEAELRRFWRRNASSRAKRRSRQRESGRLPVVVSAELLGDLRGADHVYASLSGDLLAGETGRAIAQHLQSLGWTPERAWAFVWRRAGFCWDDVAYLLLREFGFTGKEAALRKWGERNFDAVVPELRRALWDEATAAMSRN